MRQVVISGGTGGLGQPVVKRFLAEGYQVVIADIMPETPELLQEICHNIHSLEPQIAFQRLKYFQVNLLDANERTHFASKLDDVDILVNLVGGFAFQNFLDTTEKTLDQMLDLNLRSCFFLTQALLNKLKQSEHGRIINIGCRQAIHGAAMVSAYALSKAAVVNLTQSLAQELIESNLTVNAILPSTIDTPKNRTEMPEADFDRWVHPEDLATTIVFLASTEARAISGAVIPVYHKA